MPRSRGPPCAARAARASWSALRRPARSRRGSSRRSRAAAEPACRARSRASIGRASRAKCGSAPRSRSECCRDRAGRGVLRPELDAAKAAAADVRDAVMPREALVDERVVGGSRSTTLRSSRSTLANNSSVSCAMHGAGCRRTRWSSGSRCRAGAGRATAPRSSSTSASAFGSASMRRTSRSRTAGCESSPAAAAASNARPGMLLQRKNDRRDASSTSLRR